MRISISIGIQHMGICQTNGIYHGRYQLSNEVRISRYFNEMGLIMDIYIYITGMWDREKL